MAGWWLACMGGWSLAALAATPGQTACDAGDAAACTTEGIRYLQGDGVPQDRFYATRLFRQACNADHGPGCLQLGQRLNSGEGVRRDLGDALEALGRACELKEGEGCRALGDLFIQGGGLGGSDGRQAGIWYALGCDLDDAPSCTGAALWSERGDLGRADAERARLLLDKACRLGHPRGCTQLGMRHLRGLDGAARNVAQAATWFRQGCEAAEPDPEACRELGDLEARGKGVPRDRAAARRHLQVACEALDPMGCRLLAAVALAEGAPQEALRAAQKGCEAGEATCCKRAQKLSQVEGAAGLER